MDLTGSWTFTYTWDDGRRSVVRFNFSMTECSGAVRGGRIEMFGTPLGSFTLMPDPAHVAIAIGFGSLPVSHVGEFRRGVMLGDATLITNDGALCGTWIAKPDAGDEGEVLTEEDLATLTGAGS